MGSPLENLAIAQEVRKQRAQLKRDIAAGKLSPADVLLDPPPYMHTAAVTEVLTAGPAMGRKKAERVCGRLNVRTTARLRDLSEIRRRAVVDRIRIDYPRMWRRWTEPRQEVSA